VDELADPDAAAAVQVAMIVPIHRGLCTQIGRTASCHLYLYTWYQLFPTAQRQRPAPQVKAK